MTFDYVTVCKGLHGTNKNMEVVEDLECRPHTAVTSQVVRETRRLRKCES